MGIERYFNQLPQAKTAPPHMEGFGNA